MQNLGTSTRIAIVALFVGASTNVTAQQPEPATRTAAIEQEQSRKALDLHPYVPDKFEALLNKFETVLTGGVPQWHPFLDSAYSGGGFTLGLGYLHFVSPFNQIDFRGSYSALGYKRVEAEFKAPRLFHRRGELTILGGWREATQARFYGIGMDTSKDDRTSFDFRQPRGSANLTFWPTRRLWMLSGGAELSQWSQRPGEGDFPSVNAVYTPQELPGLGTTTTYLHSQGTVGFDWRPAQGYARRGGFYGVTFHDYADNDEKFGFRQVDYEVTQHFPILREAWVISLHGLAQTTFTKSDQEIPFFMLPTMGSGSTLRAYTSQRFRDQNSLLLQAEWRIMANRFLDTAVFYDAGKVAARRSDLNLDGLKSDVGVGVRFHGPFATPLRIEVAHGNEGFTFIFVTHPAF
jgi:hypothetical protein